MASSKMLKDPNEVRLIPITWRGSIPRNDAIIASTWLVSPTGQLTLSQETADAFATAALASNGVAGTNYSVTNRITSQYGLVLEKTVIVRVQDRVG